MLVFSLAILLVGGMILLGVAVVRKASGTACPGGEADIAAAGPVVNVVSTRDGLHVITRPPEGGMKILTLDPCRGRVLGTVTLKTHK